MPRFVRPFAVACTMAVLPVAAVTQRADAALSAEVWLVPQQSSVVVDGVLGVDVFLRNLTDTNTASPARVIGVDLDFGGVAATSSPLRFAPAAGAPAGFVAAGGFASALSIALDGSLVDGHASGFPDLSYAAPFPITAASGLPSNAADVQVGTIYVMATSPGTQTLSANFAGTLVQSGNANFDAFVPTFVNATFIAVAVPEPASGLALVAGGVAWLGRRRRS